MARRDPHMTLLVIWAEIDRRQLARHGEGAGDTWNAHADVDRILGWHPEKVEDWAQRQPTPCLRAAVRVLRGLLRDGFRLEALGGATDRR
jgi:hypothetical protein